MIVATYSTGMCRTDTDNKGIRYHAVETGEYPDAFNTWTKALCGYKPGKRSNGWSSYIHSEVTCPKCLKKLEKLQEVK